MTSVRSVAQSCLGKSGTLSLRKDVLGVYASDNPRNRSLKARIDLIETTPFVRIAVVEIAGASSDFQTHFDTASDLYEDLCNVWIYVQDHIVSSRSDLLQLDHKSCTCPNIAPSSEVKEIYDLGRSLGAEIVCYYVQSMTNGNRGCAAHPSNRLGFVVADSASDYTFVHELTHVLWRCGHKGDSNNLMFKDGTSNITHLPPDLTSSQIKKIQNDKRVESC